MWNLQGKPELLVQWAPNVVESATWEDQATFQEAYPDFELEDKLNAEEGSNVMVANNRYGKVYQKRKKEPKAIGGG